MSIYDDGIEKAIEALKAYNEKRNSTPTPKREPLTVHVSRRREGGNLNFYSELFENEYWEHIGEFILQPKEQTP